MTPAEVAEIRASRLPGVQLARRFGVDETTISRVRLNKSHVDPDYAPPPRRIPTSRQNGVHWHGASRRWRVAFRRQGQLTIVGYFHREESAVEAARKFEADDAKRKVTSVATAPEAKVTSRELSPEMRAWIARRRREIAGEPLTLADREQLTRHVEDVG